MNCLLEVPQHEVVLRAQLRPSPFGVDRHRGAAAGPTCQLSAVRHQNRSPLNFGPPLPPGTVLTIVDVDRSGTPGAELCTGVITDGDQRWQAEGLGVFSPIARDGVTATCTKPGRLQFAFLLPHDVVPTAVDVTINGQITVRLEL